jgi:phospholipid/cholesterol/gamma-HCH transport system substrate-binding protein
MKGRSWAEVLAGLGVLAVAAVFLGYAILHGGRGGTAPGLTLTAEFDRVDGLSVGADVKIAGVKVGSVASLAINPQSFNAVVTLRVDPTLRLPRDTSAEITSEGLLGGRFVALVPGGEDRLLADGGRISETQGSVSLESLLGRFIFSVTQMNSGGAPNGDAPAAPR